MHWYIKYVTPLIQCFMIKIALIGWSGKNNFGDNLMQSLLKKELSYFGEVTEYSDIDDINIIKSDKNLAHLHNDILVFGGGNIISSEFWPFNSLDKIKKNQKVLFLNVNITSAIHDETILLNKLKQLNATWIVRDSESARLLSEYQIIAQVIPDIVLGTQPSPIINKKHQALFFLNQFYFNKLFSDNISDFLESMNVAKTISQHIDWLKTFGWDIVLVPSQITNELDDRIPSAFIGRLSKTFKSNKWIDHHLNNNEIIELIKESELIISMRLHPALIGVSNNIPTIMLSFNEKFNNIFIDLHLQNILIDIEELNHKKLIQVNQLAESSINLTAEKLDNYFQKYSLTYNEFLKGYFSY